MATFQNSGPLTWSRQYKVWPTANCVVRLVPHFWLPATSPVNCRLSSHDPSFQPLPSTKIRMSFFHFRNFTSLGFLLSDRTECFVSVSLTSLTSFWLRPRSHVRWNEQAKVPHYYETRFFTKIFFQHVCFHNRSVGTFWWTLASFSVHVRWLRLNQVKLTCQKQWVALAAVHFSAEST